MSLPQRRVFHSVPAPGGKGWVVEEQGKILAHHPTQAASEADAISRGHAEFKAGGLGQAVLHGADGRIREERT